MNSTEFPKFEKPIGTREKHYPLFLYILKTNDAFIHCILQQIKKMIPKDVQSFHSTVALGSTLFSASYIIFWDLFWVYVDS